MTAKNYKLVQETKLQSPCRKCPKHPCETSENCKQRQEFVTKLSTQPPGIDMDNFYNFLPM